MNIPELDSHIAKVMAQITDAASRQDLQAIQRLSRKAAELQEMKEQVAAINNRMAVLDNEDAHDPPVVTTGQSNPRTRELPVEVTEGDIRQNLLKLTPHIKRGKIKIGEQLIIEALPSGERFQTDLCEKGNKLRARGEIARFYKEATVKAGDYVLLTEVSQGHWILKKAPFGEYGLSRLRREY
jgi:Asp-tRNA(Asn)/Glu-tRNA(Gln) amidotransferase C subunit